MKGMSRKTGKYLNDLEHLKQSIVDILTTPVGSRVMRREYGSNLFYLVDRPVNRDFLQQIYAAVRGSGEMGAASAIEKSIRR